MTEVTVEGISTGLYLMLTFVMAWFLKEMVMPIWSFEVLWNKLATTFQRGEIVCESWICLHEPILNVFE